MEDREKNCYVDARTGVQGVKKMKKLISLIICIGCVAVLFSAEKPSKLNNALMKKNINVKTVQKLISEGEDVNQKYWGYYPIERVGNNLEVLKILLEAGAEGKESYFSNALWNVYDDEIIKYICENDILDPNDFVNSFRHYFDDASKTLEDKCQHIISVTDGKLSNPLILRYVSPEDYDKASELLNLNFKYTDKKGNSSLHLIADYLNENSANMLKYAIERGADVNHLNNNKQTALFYAITAFGPTINWDDPVNEDEEQAKINFVSDMPYYQNPKVLQQNQIEIVNTLLQKKISINQKDNFGWTVLHYANAAYPAGLSELLIANGADKNIKTNFGKTAEDIRALRK